MVKLVVMVGLLLIILFEMAAEIIKADGNNEEDNDEEIHTDCMWK